MQRYEGAGAGPGGPFVYGTPTVSRETVDVRTAAEIAAAAPDGLVDETPIATAARTAVAVIGGAMPRIPRPHSQRLIVVANQKGGVGKTTSTVNLAASLAMQGTRVLVVDLDPQGNASTALGVDHHSDVPSVYDVLVEGRPLAEIIQPVGDVKNLWCAPATIDLAGAEIELVSLVARESRLKRAIDAYGDHGGADMDYILIDCPPSLGLLTVNALVAGREVLIPIQCEYYALEGLGQLLQNIDLVKAHLNPALHVSTILLTMYDARTRLAHQVADEVRTHFGDTVLKTAIPRSVRISEAPSYGQTVLSYDPGSTGALSYLEAARELAVRGPAAQTTTGADGSRPEPVGKPPAGRPAAEAPVAGLPAADVLAGRLAEDATAEHAPVRPATDADSRSTEGATEPVPSAAGSTEAPERPGERGDFLHGERDVHVVISDGDHEAVHGTRDAGRNGQRDSATPSHTMSQM